MSNVVTSAAFFVRRFFGRSPWLRYIGILFLVCICWVSAALLSLIMAIRGAPSYAIWWPSGVSMAALLIFGYRMWPATAMGCLLYTYFFAPEGFEPGSAVADVLEGLSVLPHGKM